MNSISVISSLAMAVGLAASLPQILRMLRTRSSGGQSVLGWGMGLVTNLSMAYVNLFGFHAKALTASNLVSATLCVLAMVLIVRFAARAAAPAAAPQAPDDLAGTVAIPLRVLPAPVGPEAFADLPTTELVAITDAALEARERRARRASQAGAEVLVAA